MKLRLYGKHILLVKSLWLKKQPCWFSNRSTWKCQHPIVLYGTVIMLNSKMYGMVENTGILLFYKKHKIIFTFWFRILFTSICVLVWSLTPVHGCTMCAWANSQDWSRDITNLLLPAVTTVIRLYKDEERKENNRQLRNGFESIKQPKCR